MSVFGALFDVENTARGWTEVLHMEVEGMEPSSQSELPRIEGLCLNRVQTEQRCRVDALHATIEEEKINVIQQNHTTKTIQSLF